MPGKLNVPKAEIDEEQAMKQVIFNQLMERFRNTPNGTVIDFTDWTNEIPMRSRNVGYSKASDNRI